MKFWKTKILLNKRPIIYVYHSNDTYTAKDLTEYWQNIFAYTSENITKEISTKEISKEECFSYWEQFGYFEPYGIINK